MKKEEYIKKFREVVIDSVRGIGLFPSVLMAQALLESSNKFGEPGESILAKVYANHFGIKADANWKGKRINLKTHEVVEGRSILTGDYFRIYDDPKFSFIDRNFFLLNNPRYGKAGVFNAKTPEEQAEAIQRGGYATDPLYAEKLKTLIHLYELVALDIEAKKKHS